MTFDSVASTNGPSPECQLEIFRRMLLIRMCDEKIIATIRAGQIIAPYYSPKGHEAISAAMMVNLNIDDYVVTIYRGLHDHLAKGVPPAELVAEYAGRVTGSCKGKGGPMHITHPESGVMVTTGVVGSGLPIANGLAWASQLRGDGRVTVVTFGDGASNIGAFHEALNMASLWKLPVIFMCQNNGYGEHSEYSVGTSVESIALRGSSYGMPGVSVDGNDAVAMWKVAHEAVARARAGQGPTLIEAHVRRLNGHILGDPGEYIPKEVFAGWLAAEPVARFRRTLIAENLADEEQLGQMAATIGADLERAFATALSAPYPEEAELARDVYLAEVRI